MTVCEFTNGVQELKKPELTITPPTLPPETEKVVVKLLSATPPTLPVPSPAPIPVPEQTSIHLMAGEDGVLCLGAPDVSADGTVRLFITNPKEESQSRRLSEQWDNPNGIWLEGCNPEGPLGIGIQSSESNLLHPLPAHRHWVHVDEKGIQSIIDTAPGYSLLVPKGTNKKLSKNDFWQIEVIDSDEEQELLRIVPRCMTEAETMEFSIPTLDSKIIIKRMSLNATIRIEIDSPSENENAPDQKVRLVFQGNRPIQGIVRMEGAAAAPPIYFSLDPQHQETTISLPDGGWGAENTLVYLETDEQIITRRTRLLPRTAVSRLCCWPPILYWKDAENPLTIGAFKEHSSNLDLTVIFPPELARSRVEKDKPESSTLSLYLSAENLPNAWIGMITVRDRISRAVGRIPILRSQTKETKPTP